MIVGVVCGGVCLTIDHESPLPYLSVGADAWTVVVVGHGVTEDGPLHPILRPLDVTLLAHERVRQIQLVVVTGPGIDSCPEIRVYGGGHEDDQCHDAYDHLLRYHVRIGVFIGYLSTIVVPMFT